MKIIWKVTKKDIKQLQKFIEQQKDKPFVKKRIERNLKRTDVKLTKKHIWRVLVGCLLTTQQRSGPTSKVNKFLRINPFPFEYDVCLKKKDIVKFCRNILSEFGGIRRTISIAEEIKNNLNYLENGLWNELIPKLKKMVNKRSAKLERVIADFIDDKLQGFGPKQSRNFLQWLGLTRYEIPIDSRIIKWLNNFGFPVVLSATALGDRNYYHFVSDGIKQLCAASDIYPCILDAAIFASFDGDNWTVENIGY